jgi:hypothetical protein
LPFPWFGSSGSSLGATGQFLPFSAEVVAPRWPTLGVLQNILTQALTNQSTQALLVIVEGSPTPLEPGHEQGQGRAFKQGQEDGRGDWIRYAQDQGPVQAPGGAGGGIIPRSG